MAGCDYGCGREAKIHLGVSSLCPVCNRAGKKVSFDKDLTFLDAWDAFEENYHVQSLVTKAIKAKHKPDSDTFYAAEIRGKWRVALQIKENLYRDV